MNFRVLCRAKAEKIKMQNEGGSIFEAASVEFWNKRGLSMSKEVGTSEGRGFLTSS